MIATARFSRPWPIRTVPTRSGSTTAMTSTSWHGPAAPAHRSWESSMPTARKASRATRAWLRAYRTIPRPARMAPHIQWRPIPCSIRSSCRSPALPDSPSARTPAAAMPRAASPSLPRRTTIPKRTTATEVVRSDARPRATARGLFSFIALVRHRPFDRRALEATAQRQLIVEAHLVLRRAIVPHQEIADPPLVAIDELRSHNLLEQRLQQRAALFLRHIQNVRRVALADIDRLPPRARMRADHRMDRIGRILGACLRRERRAQSELLRLALVHRVVAVSGA